MKSALPLDIHRCIIDSLWDDKSSLSSCTLVCHGWLHPARTHLFDEILVTSTSLELFLVFLCSETDVLPYIKTLHLSHRRDIPSGNPAPELDVDTLSTILSHLTSLRSLHLQSLFIRGRGMDTLRYPQRFSLDQLHIIQCSRAIGPRFGESLVDIMDFICLFERIGILTFEMLYWVQRHPGAGEWQPPGAVQVDEVHAKVNELWWWNAWPMFEKLIGRSPGPRALAFHCGDSWSDVCGTGSLIAAAGMHLRRLTLNFSWLKLRGPLPATRVKEGLSFAGLSCLEDVCFVLFLEDFQEEMGLAWSVSRVCADILSTAAQLRALTTVTLVIEVPNDIPANLNTYAIDWEYLNDSMRGLSALRRISVLFRCLSDEATAAGDRPVRVAQQGLPIAASKGILEVNIEYGCQDLLD